MKRKLSPWLAGIVAATLLLAALALFTSFHYIGSDDLPILRSFMGYEGGVPAHFHLFLHTFLAWMLFGLSSLFPGVAWFSILQLFLLWLSCAVIVKSAVSCAQNQGVPGWAGILVGLVFLGTFAAFPVCRISFTTTGALVGAAAVAQLLSVDYRQGSDRQILRGMGFSVVLLLCCYCLRQINVLPPLAFWLLSLTTIWLSGFHLRPFAPIPQSPAPGHLPSPCRETPEKDSPLAPSPSRSPKPLLIGMLLCAVSFGLFAGVRAIEIKVTNQEDYLAWQNTRSRLFDYTGFYENTSAETLSQVGWSPAKFKLVTNWYFWDQDITTQAFETLYAAQPEASQTPWDNLAHIPGLLTDFFAGNPAQWYACGALLAIVALCLIAQARRGGRPWAWLASLGGAALGALLLGYLAYQGRLPLRAGLSVLLPAAAFTLCHAFSCLAPSVKDASWRRIPILVLCIATLALAGLSMDRTAQYLNPPSDPEEEAKAVTPADLDAFALENPDMLIVYDLSLTSDRRLFPDTRDGIPTNLMFWGGYQARSPSWLYQLSTFGLDGNALTSQDFLRDNVLVAGTDGEPWQSLVTHVDEGAVGQVDWDFYDEYGYIGFFQLYEE